MVNSESVEIRSVTQLFFFLFGRNESFVFAASTRTPKLFLWVHDHKTIAKDKAIGEGEVEVIIFLYFFLGSFIDVSFFCFG